MPQPYSWQKLKNLGDVNVAPKSGHTVTQTDTGIYCYGGMDGRRNDMGNPSPNSDLHKLTLAPEGYRWNSVEIPSGSAIPPIRTFLGYSCRGVYCVWWHILSTPYQCRMSMIFNSKDLYGRGEFFNPQDTSVLPRLAVTPSEESIAALTVVPHARTKLNCIKLAIIR